ncbi:MAG: hypothetical protein AD073_000275 [Mycoplasmataceae bacterium]|nr:MAG: hypothetical protein AD073_000275 [Mycoplasmataceae bacterium]
MSKKYELELSYSNPKFWYNRTLRTDSKEWKDLRQIILKRDNWTCSFCGIRLSKWLSVDHIDGDGSNNNLDNFRLNCQACDKIRHSGLAGLNGEIELGLSKLSQNEIVQRSHQFYIKNHRNPNMKEIDPSCANIYPLNYINPFQVAEERELGEYYKKKYQHYKGFFTKAMDFSYLKFIIKD